MRKNWIYKTGNPSAILPLTRALSIPPALSRVLCCRGLDSPAAAQSFFANDTSVFHSPFLLDDMDKAVEMILFAIKNGEKVMIFGDYDVDGVTSTAALYRYLTSLGLKAEYYIPSRHKEGYGLSLAAAERFVHKSVDLLITVDSGVTAQKEISYLKENGVKVIVTDHHACFDVLPPADAIVNPMRKDSNYPFSGLAGVGVVFKLMCAVEMKRNAPDISDAARKILDQYGDLIAIGTVGDVMPLLNENRAIVTHGLSLLEETENIGLAALIDRIGEESASVQRRINAVYISFVLAPRINAVGRISDATLAVDLLTTQNADDAYRIAAKLCEINAERKALENRIFEEAKKKIESEIDLEKTPFLVLADDNWHHGIIGIVASRIAEKYHRSCVLISFRNEADGTVCDVGKGSGRSVGSLHLADTLHEVSDILVKYGGHKSAAGLTVMRENLPALREHLTKIAAMHPVTQPDVVMIDTYLMPAEITLDLARSLKRLCPYGTDNPQPVFSLSNYTVQSVISLSSGKHTKINLELPEGKSVPVLCFGLTAADCTFRTGDALDLLVSVDINSFQNRESVQLLLVDARTSDDAFAATGEDLSLTGTISSDEIPDPPPEDVPLDHEFPPIYMYIRDSIAADTKLRLSIGAAASEISHKYSISCSRLKLLLALRIFEECSLLALAYATCDQPVTIELLPRAEKKIPLATSRLYQRLKQYYESQVK